MKDYGPRKRNRDSNEAKEEKNGMMDAQKKARSQERKKKKDRKN